MPACIVRTIRGKPSGTVQVMARRRVLKSVLANFLGTYSSRYSDYDGYWLFGFLVDDLANQLKIDLVTQCETYPNSACEAAFRYARLRFAEQCVKAGIVPSQIREAWLWMTRLPGSVQVSVNGRPCHGYRIRFTAAAVTDFGRRYEREQTAFVAPHNPAFEYRSTRAISPNSDKH